jgi:hypothetical protein
MTKRHSSGICAAVLFSATAGVLGATVSLVAQQPPSAQSPTPSQPPSTAPPATTPSSSAQPAPSTAAGADKITVTGCLRPAPQEAAKPEGTAGAQGGAAGSEKFVLTNVTPAADAAAPSTTSPAKTYRLVANDDALTPHAGKKIEVTGTVVEQAGAAGQASASSSSPASAANAPKLTVESGKILAPSCAD